MNEFEKRNALKSTAVELHKQFFTTQPDAVSRAAAPAAMFEIFSLTKTNVPLVYSNNCQK